jgi:predicted metal-binding membrane protein
MAMPKTSGWPLDRDRTILLGGCLAVTGFAWLAMVRLSTVMTTPGGHTMLMGEDAGTLSAMWAVMMVAMMLPSTLPFVFAFSQEQRRRQAHQGTVVPTAFFVAGYLVVWVMFGAVCAALQEFLHRRALLSPLMVSTSFVLSACLLMAAGVYQWTPLKNACLHHCRTPFAFLLGEWREGKRGAVRMGAEHGLFCVGCCWMLMLLPFAAGVMDLRWMAGITVLLMLEKAAPGGEWVSRIAGGVLAAAGAGVLWWGMAR